MLKLLSTYFKIWLLVSLSEKSLGRFFFLLSFVSLLAVSMSINITFMTTTYNLLRFKIKILCINE